MRLLRNAVLPLASFRPIVFVRNGEEEINRFGSLSGEISQHQREGLADSNRNGEPIFRAKREGQLY